MSLTVSDEKSLEFFESTTDTANELLARLKSLLVMLLVIFFRLQNC